MATSRRSPRTGQPLLAKPRSWRTRCPAISLERRVPRAGIGRLGEQLHAPDRPLAPRQHRHTAPLPGQPQRDRGLQGVARRPARQRRSTAISEHTTPTTPDTTCLLRTDHRVGMDRRPNPQPDHRTRHPTTPRTPAPIPRRPRRSQADGRREAHQPTHATDSSWRVLSRTGIRASEVCNLDPRRRRLHRRQPLAPRSRSANSATTATSPCIQTSSRCWPHGPPTTSNTSATTDA